MKRFAFTLQSIYDIALAKERQLKLDMQKIEDRRKRIQKELDDTKSALSDAKKKSLQEMCAGVDADRLMQYEHYFDKLGAIIAVLKENKAKIEREKEKCLQAQIENRKEIKTLEKLREKQYEEYLLELRSEEEKAIGDLVAYRSTIH